MPGEVALECLSRNKESGTMIRSLMVTTALLFAVNAAPAAQVTFYQLPQGAFPHDVSPGANGTVWYSGQTKGVLGIFDPKTGKAEHVPLGPGSAPHGVIQGPDGVAWLTDGGQNAMVRFDPVTRAVKVYPLPRNFPNANLNTPVVDKEGIVWFTGQSGVYGRVDPKSGKVDAWAAPRGRGAYGITVTPGGDVWYASLAGDHIAKIDRASGQATVVEPPRKGVGPRRIWSDSKGNLWASFWNAGGIGKYDPSRQTWTHYPMPQSKSSTYSVYVDDKDHVWATDWQANAIQRFDPVTETYATFPSDKRGASIRQMLGRPGEAWGGESGTDRLVVVRD
jgi:virginiamycin B lyase